MYDLDEPDEALRAIEKYRCETDLLYFFERAWREIDPANLKINWHHQAICTHLEAVTRGEIKRLLINVPPRPISETALIDTKRGLIPLSEVRIGDMVLTHKRRWRAVTAVHEQGELPTLRLTTAAGLPLDVAPDHPVLTPSGWENAGDLQRGDVIGIVPGSAFLKRLWRARTRPSLNMSGRFDFDRDLWGEVLASTENAGVQRCRCLTVDEDGSFVANGVAVKNSSKTNLVNVIYPAWTWIQPTDEEYPLAGPAVKFMCISYGQTLSTDIAVLARRLIRSEWYQGHWGDRVQLREDQGRIEMFANEAGGFRLATSMSGATLGRGGSVRIVDDPQNVEDANSTTETEKVVRTYREALQTRETDPSTSVEIIIMQRLNEGDLSGYVLQEANESGDDSLVHLMYPLLHAPDRHCTTPWYDDPRTEQDELLWPEQFPPEVVARYRRAMGEYGFANQMQQLPTPRGGGLFKREWLEMWPPLDQEGNLMKGYINQGRIQYPAFEYVVAWVDTAFTTKQENDFCAMCVFGIFRAEGKGRIEKRNDGTFVRVADDYGFPKVMLVYGWQKRLTIHGPPQEVPVGVDARDWNGPQYREKRQETWGLVEWVADTCKRYKVDHLGIETQAAGHTLEQELARLHSDNIWTVELVPAKGDKVARAYAVQGIVSSKQLYVPTFEDGSHPSWATPIVDQWLIFPKGRHDDATDVMTGALRHLRDIGIFDRREDWHAEEERAQLWQTNRRTTLPYGLGG